MDTCNSYSSGIVALQLGSSQPLVVTEFLEAAESGEAAYDLMFEIRTSRNDAGYVAPEALLRDFPAFGAFSRLAEYIALGPSQFVGYEALVVEAVDQSDSDCERAFEALDAADAAA